MDEALKGATPQVEGAEPTEGAKPTQAKVEPTIKTYIQKELDEAVGKGLSSIQTQLSLQKAETIRAKAEVERLKTLQESIEADRNAIQQEAERFLEEHDPDALKGYKNTKAQEAREKKLASKEQELKLVEAEQEGLRNAIILNNKANEMQAKYQVPRDVLEACSTEEQMEKIAKAFPEVGEAKVEKTPKFDSGLSSGIASRSFAKIEQDYADGKVSTAEYEEAMKERKKR